MSAVKIFKSPFLDCEKLENIQIFGDIILLQKDINSVAKVTFQSLGAYFNGFTVGYIMNNGKQSFQQYLFVFMRGLNIMKDLHVQKATQHL